MNAASDRRQRLAKPGRWVVKIGSALLTNDGLGLDRQAMAGWVSQLARLAADGYEILLVSSGSIAEGIIRLGWDNRPTSIHALQAAAAVGQMGLAQAYEVEFKRFKIHSAQILLTHDDLSDRERYLNARSTLKTLLDLKVIPVVNENDTVVTDEIRFGDNDTLAGLVANLVQADMLVILTDQNGLYQSDPRSNPDAEFVDLARSDNPKLEAMAGSSGGRLGRGGMQTKVAAARLAQRSGTDTLICNGRESELFKRLRAGECLGTYLYAEQAPVAARKQWLAGQLQVRGALVLDSGAVRVLKEQGRSLLSVGVISVSGDFRRGDLVSIQAQEGVEIARGLVNYSSVHTTKIMGRSSAEIQSILGFHSDDELVHRDDLVLLNAGMTAETITSSEDSR